MSYQSTTELKNIARDKMLGKYGTAIGAFLFIRSIILTGSILATSMANSNGVMYLAIGFVFMLFEGVFVYGELSIYLKIAVGMQTSVGDVLSAFRTSADRAIKARLIYVAILYGTVMVGAAIEALVVQFVPETGKVVASIAWILLIAVGIYLFLTYSQIMYFMHDFQDITVREACRRSRELMTGQKFTLLYMYVSFIPLYILGILSLMVGLYFIHPYVKMTFTEFYLDRVRQTQNSQQTIDVTV